MSSARPEGLVTLQMLAASETLELTLLELVRAITESTSDDREVLATVVHLLRSGRVRLRGNFRGTVLDAA